jgi:hypothetical protein
MSERVEKVGFLGGVLRMKTERLVPRPEEDICGYFELELQPERN